MKFLICFAFLSAFFAYSKAQETCRGRPIFQVCTGGRDEGNNNAPLCSLRQQQMWYYDSITRNCDIVNYKGCGGNNNRYCSREHCLSRCRS